MEALSAAAARRLALSAQGLAGPRLKGPVGPARARAAYGGAGIVQIDSVNVLCRSHELPLFSRLGPHHRNALPDLAYRRREAFEYWGHEASFLPVRLQPLLRWRMARAGDLAWGRMARVGRDHPVLVEEVLEEITDRGPLTARELEAGAGGRFAGRRRNGGPWWGWGDVKTVLEWLFWCGRITAAQRRATFERVYDLTERVIPPAVLAAATPDEEASRRELVRFAAARYGVATAADLADYFRLGLGDTRLRVAELVEDGALVPVAVEGWKDMAYLDPTAAVPGRRPQAAALLSPFDSLIWHRPRTERLFGMRYRIEIYTPAPQRVHGYYVLPFLLGDQLVARLDLAAERKRGVLVVKGAYAEPPQLPGVVAEPLRSELAILAGYLGLHEVEVTPRGDLAPVLRRGSVQGRSGVIPDTASRVRG